MSSMLMKKGTVSPKTVESRLEIPALGGESAPGMWKRVKNVRDSRRALDAVPVLAHDEWTLSCEQFIARAEALAKASGRYLLGQGDAQRFFQNQNLIPAEFDGLNLLFLGTRWRRQHFGLCVPILVTCGRRYWKLGFSYVLVDRSSFDLAAMGSPAAPMSKIISTPARSRPTTSLPSPFWEITR